MEKRDEYAKNQEKELEYKGIEKGQNHMNKPAFMAKPEKKKKGEVFGWDVFNEDSIYNAYKKRCKENDGLDLHISERS